MPRRYRITSPGYYHVINRGVERRVVFLDEEDYDAFLDILKSTSKQYKTTIHAFVLMNNHYHILMETFDENISDAVKFLNGSYSVYFNQKYKRTGHLWQGRFFSNYLFDDEHFWIVAKYIERNSIKAYVVKNIEDYRYQSLFHYMNKQKHFEVIKDSKILEMSVGEYYGFVNSDMNKEYLDKVYTEPKAVTKDGEIRILNRRLESFFEQDREINKIQNIKKTFDYGYRKSDIARHLGISITTVSKYLK